jgi:hypothetical protein
MGEIITWITTTPVGLAAVIGSLVVIFIIVSILAERKTRKLYPDRNRRGTKAVAKAKKKKAVEKTAEKTGTKKKPKA